jgi:DnaJ like chaperone protein
MAYWGKIIGGIAGFAMGGPAGAIFGATLGHAADTGRLPRWGSGGQAGWPGGGLFGLPFPHPITPATLPGGREHLFSLGVVTLSAKLAKADGPVNRAEIAAFRAAVPVPPEALAAVGQVFDQARAHPGGHRETAAALGAAFPEQPGKLEQLLAVLFSVARADGPVNQAEWRFLSDIHAAFRLDQAAWNRARAEPELDAYAVLGVSADASPETLRAAWKELMRAHHPDSLAARGAGAEAIARASEKVARINAAWDRIKRERGL